MDETIGLSKARAHHRPGGLCEAAAHREALKASPDNPQLQTRVGEALHAQGKSEEAIAAFQNAVRLDPQHQPAWFFLGCVWLERREDAIAADCLQKAAGLAPDHALSRHNLGRALFRLGLTDEAIGQFHNAIALGEDTLARAAIATAIPGSPSADHRAILLARREWAHAHFPAQAVHKKFLRKPIGCRPLRVGYISSFFQWRNWMKPVWGLVNHHDRRRVQVCLFSDGAQSACSIGYLNHPTDEFYDISGFTCAEAAERIAACDLDILVDLNGFSQVDRLAVLALKPSPIIVAWFNMYATSGMACYDYLIGDGHVILPEEEVFYTEKVLRLPGCYLTFEVSYPVPDVVAPPVSTGAGLTFGCLASQYKITPQVVETWSDILRRSPNARLFLKNSTLGSQSNRDFLFQCFERQGIARDRIEMDGPSEHYQFLAAYGRVDIALDTFPYNGGTTTSEAIWQGVPVLTFRGDRWAARQSTSILTEANLEEFIAANREDYIELAVALARASDTPARLTEVRRTMRSRIAQSSVCDTAALARRMEELYRRIFDDWSRLNP